jgi:hypothetical protein
MGFGLLAGAHKRANGAGRQIQAVGATGISRRLFELAEMAWPLYPAMSGSPVA